MSDDVILNSLDKWRCKLAPECQLPMALALIAEDIKWLKRALLGILTIGTGIFVAVVTHFFVTT